MKFPVCPLCGEATDVGSHWDCVFEMMLDWVTHRQRAPEVVHTNGVAEKVEEKDG